MMRLDRNGFDADAVKKALHAVNRTMDFRYELLDNQNRVKRLLGNVLKASVANNALAQIKRTARFTLVDDGGINYLSDHIKPYARLRMPDGGWAEWPLGVFLLSTPPRKVNDVGSITREIEAYDLLQLLVDDKVVDRYTVSSGTNYITAVRSLLTGAGILDANLTSTTKTLPAARDWNPGKTKLQIINDLLGAINFRSLFFSEDGAAVAQPYVSPADRASEYVYADNEESVIFPDAEHALDLFGVANKWVLVVSEPDRAPLIGSYTNNNSSSLTSTISRGRTIVDYREQQEAADQSTIDALAQRIAFEASQVYETVDFDTAIMPMHSDSDVYTLQYSSLGLNAKYSEVSWEFELRPGSKMKHKIRRVVLI